MLITSRPNLYLQKMFSNISRLEIATEISDVQTYVESEIDRNDRLCDLTSQDPDLKLHIVKTVSEKAAGM